MSNEIAEKAAEVARQDDAFEDAVAASEQGAETLLWSLLQLASPALPALCSLIPGTENLRGLQVAHRGEESMVWTEDEHLVLLAPDLPPDGTMMSTGAPIEIFGEEVIAQVAASLRVALDGQLRGGKRKSTARIERRAAVLRSLEILVRNLETNILVLPSDG